MRFIARCLPCGGERRASSWWAIDGQAPGMNTGASSPRPGRDVRPSARRTAATQPSRLRPTSAGERVELQAAGRRGAGVRAARSAWSKKTHVRGRPAPGQGDSEQEQLHAVNAERPAPGAERPHAAGAATPTNAVSTRPNAANWTSWWAKRRRWLTSRRRGGGTRRPGELTRRDTRRREGDQRDRRGGEQGGLRGVTGHQARVVAGQRGRRG